MSQYYGIILLLLFSNFENSRIFYVPVIQTKQIVEFFKYAVLNIRQLKCLYVFRKYYV
jgi:hypothetical protein